jgi:hypothetical protein
VLPEDGPEGPKHVGAAKKKHLNTNCSILYFNKQCIRWANNFIHTSIKEIVTKNRNSLYKVC